MPDPAAYPMLLEPRYLEKPWGGRRLETAFGRALPAGKSIGESWEMFDRPEGSSRVRNGPLAGRRLAELRGPKGEVPLLLKILDAREPLSLQVHPDEASALADGGDPKTEAWVVLAAGPDARVWRGLKDGVGAEAFREAVAAGRAEECLHSFRPEKGDAVFIPAGMPHGLGGALVAEIQQNSDTTWRLHDWGRPGPDGSPRPLHVEEGLRAVRYAPRGPDRVPPEEIRDDGRLRRLGLVRCDRFAVEHMLFAGCVTFETARSGSGRWHALLVLSGRGTIRAFDRRAAEAPFGPGDTVLLPAAHEEYEIEPSGAAVVEALSFYPAS